ncbi:TRAP transporter substrate-binding protein DctP [Bacillus sp. B15-48]|uniref:TRAP transporter substrate-binding protein DctP n=1 Tax=Bacillus sp. B15-48 TaxID=1548601 RepID=UPI00193FFD1C|nr:TRAP transporter substrate-binding protein DctP [Bacillus sp. B15-48]MBM4763367.1 hypothetical protein [Bacillus sp. B15-48]
MGKMKTKRKSFLICLMFVLFSLLAACSSADDVGTTSDNSNQSEESYIFRVATSSVATDADSVFLYKAYMDKATELSDGRIQFEWYPAEQLGKLADFFTMTNNGVTDIGMFTASVFNNEMPLMNKITGLPGLFGSAYEGTMALHAVSKQSPMLESDFLRHGVRPLLAATTPTFNFYSKGVKVNKPADLKGLKVRVSAGTLSEIIQKAGGVPVTIPSPDIYEAYDKGAFDVLMNLAGSDEVHGIRELSQWGTRNLNFASGTTGLMINEELWQSLPQNIQNILLEAGDYVAEHGSTNYQNDITEREEKWIANGDVPLHDLTEEERAEWQKLFDDFAQKFIEKQDVDFKIAFEQFEAEVAKVKE